MNDAMCDHDVFDSWVGGHRCPDVPRRFWLGPVMAGRVSGPVVRHSECGWTVGWAGLFAAWTGWK